MPVPSSIKLHQILCIKKERRKRNDNTVAYEGKLNLIEDRLTVNTVIVEQRVDGKLYLKSNGKYLKYRQVKPRPKANLAKPVIQKRRKPIIPLPDHPWRNFSIGKKYNK